MYEGLEEENMNDRLAKRLKRIAARAITELRKESAMFKTHPGFSFDELVVLMDDELNLGDDE